MKSAEHIYFERMMDRDGMRQMLREFKRDILLQFFFGDERRPK